MRSRRHRNAAGACHLWQIGTQTVFGEGSDDASVIMIGEQPGDREDLAGRPFVGPAGQLLDRALEEAGVRREKIYLTNVVKHFKWVLRGKRRIHQKPNAAEIHACLPWLKAELDMIRPKVIVLLGATAAQAILGRDFRVTQNRGIWLETEFHAKMLATVHPSSILRAPADLREIQYSDFVRDLSLVAQAVT
jgi:DNA polymerase